MSSSTQVLQPTPRISIVIPAYNEKERIPAYLESIRDYCCSVFPGRYEVIVVDDGGDDGLNTHLQTIFDWPELSVTRHQSNMGKGAAVRTGVFQSIAPYVLFADADGATPIQEEAALRERLETNVDIAIGSRLLSSEKSRTRRMSRELVGNTFSALARATLQLPFLDTQCGFKMLRKKVAFDLFSALTENGYLFDLEILALAMDRAYKVAEVPVNWHDRDGSKVSMLRDPIKMFFGLFKMRARLSRNRRNAVDPNGLIALSPTSQSRAARSELAR